MVTAHGLAGSIRAAQESETFDLGGQSASSIEAVTEAAFATPFAADNFRDGAPMIRLTLVTGAGKQARQKYDDGAQRAVTAVLQKHGYVEDRGAGCDIASAATFKIQHDTGKNLKTVVVFPKVAAAAESTDGNGDNNNNDNDAMGSLIPEYSPGYKIAACSMNVFPNMIGSNCTSWSQKKECLTCIGGLKEVVQQLDAQLIQGTPLNESEQTFYEAVVLLDDKEALVKQLAHDQVERGSITAHEKEELLQHNSERIAALSKEGKSTAKALERRRMLESLQPVSPHKLKHHAKIAKLHKELQPLLQIDTKGGRLLSIKESAAVTRKEEILQEIERLEEASREWFEDEDTFATRVEACRSEFATKAGSSRKASARQAGSSYAAAAGGAATKRGDSSGKAVNKWVTPAAKGKGAGGFGKKKGKLNKNDLFGAMMAESSDDDDEEETTSRTPAISAATSKPTNDETNVASATNTTMGSLTPKKKASKKKKKGKKSAGGKTDQDVDDDEFLTIAARENEAEMNEKNKPEEEGEPTALTKLIAFVSTYILPLLIAFLGWIIGLLFGKDKKPKRKRG